MLDMITDFIDYVRRGKQYQVVLLVSEADADLARSIQMAIIEDGMACRVEHGVDSVAFGQDVTEVAPGQMVIATLYHGHILAKPSITRRVLKFQMEAA